MMSSPSTTSRFRLGSFRQRRVAHRRTQIGEQAEILAQPQQAGLGPHLIGHVVPLRTADRAEDHGIGRGRLGHVGLRRSTPCARRRPSRRPGPVSVSNFAMPCALSQSIRRCTSAITSGPMPSPGRSSSLWVAIVVTSKSGFVLPGLPGRDEPMISGASAKTPRRRLARHPARGQNGPERASRAPIRSQQDGPHDRSHRLRLCLGHLPRCRGGAGAAWPAHRRAAVGGGDQRALLHFAVPGGCRRCSCKASRWSGAALPIFMAIGLFFPASLTLLTFASNRALGPVITSTLGNLAPLFAVTAAVVLLRRAAATAATRSALSSRWRGRRSSP